MGSKTSEASAPEQGTALQDQRRGTERAVPGTMAPPASALVDMDPNERFRPDGRPVGELREQLYRIPNLANVGHVLGIWIQSVGVLALAAWWGNPIGWVVAFAMCCRSTVRFAILMHEAAHRLLFSNRKWNDRVGKWLVAYPAFIPIDAYRRVHMAHHKEEFGPREPDMALYSGYPITTDSWRRKLTRDASGNSGWKNLKGLLTGFKTPAARKVLVQIWTVQVVMFALLWAVGGHWWVWPVFWLLPWMTAWRVLNRLRAVAEHAGLKASADRRETTHHIRQSALAKFILVPFNTGYHLGHHVDIGVPFSALPKFEEELREVGYIQPELEWPSYGALWRHARSGGSA